MRALAHLSDLHFGRIDAHALERLAEALVAARPDLVVVSGDLTQRARAHQFRAARGWLDALGLPWLAVPGNHDVPLHDVVSRLLWPLRRYRRHFEAEAEPVYEDEAMLVLGLNSARGLTVMDGRVNARQVQHAVARLRAAGVGKVKFVVTHHPFELPEPGHGEPIGRAGMAFPRLVDEGGADVFLAGHFHRAGSWASGAHHGARRRTLLVQAGTSTSTRHRGEGNGYNLIRVEHGGAALTVEHHELGASRFAPTGTRAFRRSGGGWIEG